jgi:hypothetical protein
MILKTRHFEHWARKTGLSDLLLNKAILEIEQGLLEADLGGGIMKRTDGFSYLVLKRTNVPTFQTMNWNL